MAQQSTTHTLKKEYRRVDAKRSRKSYTIEIKSQRQLKNGGRA